jgi:hypothetical protein
LFEIAGKLRQYVRRIRVARLFRPIDAGAGRVRHSGVALDERRDVIPDLVNIGGIWFECGLVCYCLACPERGSTELHHPFRDCIDMGIKFAAECAKHLTHANKLNPLKIPLRLFCHKC